MTDKYQKPFLKWVGGKTQILNSILDKFPNEINNYHELFLGGGSVLLGLLSLEKQKKIVIKNKIYAYDLNENLINVYKNIQKNKNTLLEFINKYINEYNSITGTEINRKPNNLEEAKTSKESYYYWLRKKYNEIKTDQSVETSALFMILNKTCFRGLYREGPNGFNVPFGHYKTTPHIINKDELDYISDLIQNVEFMKSDFKKSIKNIKKNDFVYLDPPYAPETSTSFVAYTQDGFNIDDHIELFNNIKQMSDKNIKFVMSNAKVELVLKNLNKYNIVDIQARRAINSKNPNATTTEVIIYN